MPADTKTKHKQVLDTALPYIPNASVVADIPCYRVGNNVMTSIRGYAERRPGTTTTTADNFAASGTIKRRFLWRRWSGSFIEMLNVVTGSSSIVYKLEIGTDLTFQSLFTSSSTEPFDFAVASNHVFFCNGTDMKKYDGTTATNWGITKPTSAVSTALGAGSLSPTVGYKYVIAWENQTTGHISSPSPEMAAYVVPSSQNVTITGNTTTDTQVTHVRIYRTADGGSIYFEHPSSPVTYATWIASGLTDSSADTALLKTVAPMQDQNNRPTASKGVVWYAGRLWTFTGDTVYHSGWEEIPVDTSDMPVECFPPDNFFSFGQEVTGLDVAGDPSDNGVLVVLLGGAVHKISGDTLETFRRGIISKEGYGCRQRAAITSSGKIVAWLTTGDTVHYTDGSMIAELSVPIRPDLTGISHPAAAMTFHDDGLHHWLVLMDGGAGKLRVFDQDREQWMVPWTMDGITAIHSGETSVGVITLLLGRIGTPVQMTPTGYSDDGDAYSASLTLGLTTIAEDPSPESRGYVDYISIERNSYALSDVSLLIDDEPRTGAFTSLFANQRNPPYRSDGAGLIERQYPTARGPVGRRASVKFDWPAESTNFNLYSFDTAYHER